MSPFVFCQRSGKLSATQARLRERVAAKHDGVSFVHTKLPDGWRSWFVAENKGEPIDSALSRAVMRDVLVGIGMMPLRIPVHALYTSVSSIVGEESAELRGWVSLNADLSSTELARRWRDREKP